MSALLLWIGFCGGFVNAVLALLALKVLYHIAWAFCTAVSRCRFSYAVGRAHGFRSGLRFWPWVYWPKFLLINWLMFVKAPRGSISVSSTAGYWGGIGNWHVYPLQQQAEGE